MKSMRVVLSILTLFILNTELVFAADGERVFKKCKACHTVDSTKNKIGPYLKGVFGRKIGVADGFKYSKAMSSKDIVWDAETLDAYLAKPKSYLPGNKMVFVGLKKEKDRVAIIEYLKAISN